MTVNPFACFRPEKAMPCGGQYLAVIRPWKQLFRLSRPANGKAISFPPE